MAAQRHQVHSHRALKQAGAEMLPGEARDASPSLQVELEQAFLLQKSTKCLWGALRPGEAWPGYGQPPPRPWVQGEAPRLAPAPAACPVPAAPASPFLAGCPSPLTPHTVTQSPSHSAVAGDTRCDWDRITESQNSRGWKGPLWVT